MAHLELRLQGRVMSKDNSKMRTRSGFFYIPKEFKQWDESMKLQARMLYKGEPLQGRLSVRLAFYFEPRQRMDISNAPKSILDAMQGILWKNDGQIDQLFLHRHVCGPDVPMGILIQAEEIP